MAQTLDDRNLSDPQSVWRQAAAALRSGSFAEAAGGFQRLLALGRDDPALLLGLALARRGLGDDAAAEAALERLLAADPRNLRALLLMGDLLEGRGEAIGAASYRQALVRLADSEPGAVPPDLAADVDRVRTGLARAAELFAEHLESALAAAGLREPGGERVLKSVDLLTGRKRLYLQEPTQHYFPGLPQIEFYDDRRSLGFLAAVEAAAADIRGEALEVMRSGEGVRPYVEREAGRPTFDTLGLLDNPDWSAFFVWRNGELTPEGAARCPKTVAAMSAIPFCRIPGRAPNVLFSILRPGARIPPHHGLLNSRLICHLGLVTPEGCALRVGSEVRPWREGEAFAFDDSVEHEAWNLSSSVRAVLIFDVWRPELTDRERRLVSAMIEAVEAYKGEGAAYAA